jgi:hypothetical protein
VLVVRVLVEAEELWVAVVEEVVSVECDDVLEDICDELRLLDEVRVVEFVLPSEVVESENDDSELLLLGFD